MKLRGILLSGVLILGAGTSTAASGGEPPSPEPTPLARGARLEGTLAGGSPQRYCVRLQAGDIFEATVEQLGIDLAIVVKSREAEPPATFDSLATASGRERILYVAARDEDLEFEVRAADETATAGRYRLAVDRVEPATPGDRVKAQAAALVSAAGILRRAGKAAILAQAPGKLRQALDLWRSEADPLGEATALLELAQVEDDLGKKRESLDHLKSAGALFHAVEDATGEAFCLALTGLVLDSLGDPPAALRAIEAALQSFQGMKDRKGTALALVLRGSVRDKKGEKPAALRDYAESLALSRQSGDRLLQSVALNDMARAQSHMSHPQEALARFAEALRLVEALGDRREQAWVINNMGVEFGNLGDLEESLRHYQRALLILRDTGDPYGEALTLHNMAALYSDTGDLQNAMDAYRQAQALWRAVGDRRLEGRTLLGLGKLYSILGEPDKALTAYDEALRLTEATEDLEGTATVWLNRGWEHTSLQQYAVAGEELERSLALWRQIGSPRREAAALLNLAELYLAQGQAEKALASAQQALALHRQAKDRRSEAIALHTVGKCFREIGNLPRATEAFTAALPLRVAARDRAGEAATHFQLARILRQAGDLAQARTQVEAALRLLDDVRAQILSADLKSSFLGSLDTYHRLYVDLLMEQARRSGDPTFEKLALEANEMRRARGLRDELLLAGAEVRRGLAPELLAAQRKAEQEVARLDLRLRTSIGRGGVAPEVAALEGELDDQLVKLSEVRTRIAEQSPHYADLMQPAAVSSDDLGNRWIDAGSLLIEVMLGESRSFAWVVGREGLTVIELPAGRDLEAAARALQEALPRSREPLGRHAFEAAALRLTVWILRPIQARLGTKRLVVVADGALLLVPFGLLPDPAGGAEIYQPLIARHEVVTLPSASVLAALRRRSQPRTDNTLALVADPVVGLEDPRLAAARPSRAPKPSPRPNVADGPASAGSLSRAVEDFGAQTLKRLPFSALEADAIGALIPPRQVLKATGFAANRDLVLGGQLGSYRILHFATHGLLNARHSELSGLVLSLYDPQGRPQDGFVRVHEIYNLDLPADLVVLSACRTALGREVKGEGLIGLTRAFFYAGAAGVISSLWQVDDRATAELMKRFYRELFKAKLPPAAALRQAQLSLWRDSAWQAPYYWAGFVFQGDWQERPAPRSPEPK